MHLRIFDFSTAEHVRRILVQMFDIHLASQKTSHNSWKQHVHYPVHNISLITPSTEPHKKRHKFPASIF